MTAPTREEVVLEPDRRLEEVLRAIRGARERLLMSFFRWDEPRILRELAGAVSRGLRVEALLTRRVRGWERRMRDFGRALERMHVDVRWYASPDVKYHAKYLVVDDGPALVATSNFTRECFTRTCDFLLATDDPQVVSGLKAMFEADCRAGGSSAIGPTAGMCRRLIIGPEQARTRMTALLQQARRSIRIVDPKISDPTILRLLDARRASGVSVQVLGADGFGDLRPHGRMMLIDDDLAAIGSISLSPSGLDRRRELSITTTDPTSVGRLVDFFRTEARRAVRTDEGRTFPAGREHLPAMAARSWPDAASLARIA